MPGMYIGKTLLIAGLALGASAAVAQDKPATITGASDSMLAHTCAGCHGTNGASVGPAAPTIAGMSEAYLVEVMQGFASGEVPATIMDRIAKGYDDEEIKLMAGYFSKQPFVRQPQAYDADKAKLGKRLHDNYCEKCHEDGGRSAEDDAGILASQWEPYLRYTLHDFTHGGRTMEKKMKKRMDKLLDSKGEAGIDALVHFYISQR